MANILVVEDNLIVRELIVDALNGRGHEVDAFGSIASARAAVTSNSPDLFVVDLDLPDGSGCECRTADGVNRRESMLRMYECCT